jgi:hypothetical protein
VEADGTGRQALGVGPNIWKAHLRYYLHLKLKAYILTRKNARHRDEKADVAKSNM